VPTAAVVGHVIHGPLVLLSVSLSAKHDCSLCLSSLASDGQHVSSDDCLVEDKRTDYQNCSVFRAAQSYAHLYMQFLQVN